MAQLEQLIDAETKATEQPDHHHDELRLWLRLLASSKMIENEIRRRLRDKFDVTLPRFDLMAQLDRTPRGMTLSDLSKRMMVSNGNLTALVERLAQSGHLDRTTSTADRRAQIIRLTKIGQKSFRQMAAVHETWILSMFADLSNKDVEALMKLLAKLKRSTRLAIEA